MHTRFLFACMSLIVLAPGDSCATQNQENSHRYLFIGAHPDDPDYAAGGTAALLARAGHAVKFISVTNGDAGHHAMGGEALANRRRAEAQAAARVLGIEYEVMDYHDGELIPSLEARRAIIRRIREWRADVVVGHRPNDYHPDHRYSGQLVQDAAILVQVPNLVTDVPALPHNPVFLYFEDGFTKPYPFQPDIAIDISAVWRTKIRMLDQHVSQFHEYLPWVEKDQGSPPANLEDRLEWLSLHWSRALDEQQRSALERWYGADAERAEHAEFFEIAEYGLQPSMQQLRSLFPMLGLDD